MTTQKKKRRRSLPKLPPLDVAQRFGMPEACAYLRTSLPTLYGHIKSGRIQVIREGSRTYVPGSEIARLSSLPTRDAQPTPQQPSAA